MSFLVKGFTRWYAGKLTDRLSKLGTCPLRVGRARGAPFACAAARRGPLGASHSRRVPRLRLLLLSRAGLTYHDAVAESGVYEKAIGRLPPAQQVRARAAARHPALCRRQRAAPPAAPAPSRAPASRPAQVERARRIKRAFDLSSKHAEIPASAREDPWREYKQVADILGATQREADEKAVLAGRPFIPFNLGRDQWFAYDRSTAWWWGGKK